MNRDTWREQDYKELCGVLVGLVEEGYREFVVKGTPTERPFLGVRVPKQRELAREILRGNWREFLEFEPVSFEEVNVRGFVIAGLPYEEMRKYLRGQLPLIDNWGNCDCFCSSLKSVRKHRAEFLDEEIWPLLAGSEFETRAALVILLDHYLEPEYIQTVFEVVEQVRDREEYYVRMATAWLVASVMAKFPDETVGYLQVSRLPKWTFNRAISKICDSYRVDEDMKEWVKTLRR